MKYFTLLLLLAHLLRPTTSEAQKTKTNNPPFADSDIYLVQSNFQNGNIGFGPVRNITERSGYDNQPCFDKKGNLFYVSIREDNQAEIYTFDLQKKFISKFTVTKQSEYSPKLSPDENFITHVTVEADSTQRLWKTDAATGLFTQPLAKNSDSVGYYTWINDSTIAFAKITKPMSLWSLNIRTGAETYIASDVGRSLAVSENGLLYFTQIRDGKRWLVRKESDGSLLPLIEFQDGASEDFCFGPNNLIMNGRKSSLFWTDHNFTKGWRLVSDWEKVGIKNIQRIAISPNGKWLSFVEVK